MTDVAPPSPNPPAPKPQPSAMGIFIAWMLIAGVTSIFLPGAAVIVGAVGTIHATALTKTTFGKILGVLALPLVLLGFGVRYFSIQEGNTAVVGSPPRLSAAAIWAKPEAQLPWVSAVKTNCTAYDAAPNEIKKSDIFNANQNLLASADAPGIVGTLKQLSTNEGGSRLTLEVKVGDMELTQGIKPFSAIARGTPIYIAATNMTEGSCILFSAKNFEPGSVLERSKVCDLDYNVEFTSVSPCPPDLLPPPASDPRKQQSPDAPGGAESKDDFGGVWQEQGGPDLYVVRHIRGNEYSVLIAEDSLNDVEPKHPFLRSGQKLEKDNIVLEFSADAKTYSVNVAGYHGVFNKLTPEEAKSALERAKAVLESAKQSAKGQDSSPPKRTQVAPLRHWDFCAQCPYREVDCESTGLGATKGDGIRTGCDKECNRYGDGPRAICLRECIETYTYGVRTGQIYGVDGCKYSVRPATK